MPNWKKVIVSGSNAILNNITSSGDISASGDIYATNFYGNFEGTIDSASYSDTIQLNDWVAGGAVDVVLGSNNTLYVDPDSNFTYSPSLTTLYVENLEGTASVATIAQTATSASYLVSTLQTSDADFPVAFGAGSNASSTYTRIYRDSKGYLVYNPSSNRLKINGQLALTGSILFSGTPSSGYLHITGANYIDFQVGAGGDLSVAPGSIFNFSLASNSSNINIGTNVGSNAVNLGGNGSTTTVYNFTAAGSNLRLQNLPSNTVSADSVVMWESSTQRLYYTGSSAFIQSLQQVTEQGASTTIPITASIISASGDIIANNGSFAGNLTVSGDITAEQYIINSTVTNVTMSFSSGSTIFGDSLDDTHLFTGSVDITGSLTLDGISYPTVDGENGDVITTDGLGNLSIDKPKIYMQVKNAWSTTLPKGTPVYASSSIGNLENIKPASASNADTMPAIGVLASDLDADEEGLVIVTGFINGVDTSTFNESDVVYVGADGGFTNIKPTGSNLIQNLGIVTKVDASNGSGFVYGSGRANDVPNISPGYAWVGNSDSVATAVPTSSFVGVGDNLGNHIATQDLDMAGFSISASLNITASGNISASGYVSAESLILNVTSSLSGSENPYIINLPNGVNYKEGVIKRAFDLRTLNPGDPGYGLASKEIVRVDNNINIFTLSYRIIFRGCNIGSPTVKSETTASISVPAIVFDKFLPGEPLTVQQGSAFTQNVTGNSTGVINAFQSIYEPTGQIVYNTSNSSLDFIDSAGLTTFSSGSYVTVIINYKATRDA